MPNPATAIMRMAQVGAALGGLVLYSLLIPHPFRRPGPAALRQVFEHLGTTWIRLGQALSLRFDLLPSEYCRELLTIRNEAEPLPFARMRPVIEQDLGARLEDRFSAFEPEPYVVSALSQLHRARSRDGAPLVVKILRPTVQNLVTLDLLMMRGLAVVLDALDLLGGFPARSFIRQFAPAVTAEIDYRNSVRNVRLMSLLSEDDESEINVKVVLALSQRRIVTTELMEGMSVLDALQAIQRADRPTLRRLAERGIDLTRIARRIHWNMLNQILRNGMFHADMSPSGLMILPGNQVGYVDFGMVARISRDMQDSVHYYLLCLSQEHVDRAANELLRWLEPSNATDLARAHDDIVRLLEDYLDGFRSPPHSPPREKSSGVIAELMRTARRHQMAIAPDFLLVLRAILTVDAIVFELAPAYPASQVLARYLALTSLQDAEDMLMPMQVYDRATELIHEVGHVISDFNQIQNSGRLIGISLRSLRLQLFQYVFWTAIVGMAGYVWLNGEVSTLLQRQFWLDNWLLSFGFILAMTFLLRLGWRQGRRLAAMERRSIKRRDVVDRSLGRVR